MGLFEDILFARGLDDPVIRNHFLNPDYNLGYDPFLLPDMELAVDRLCVALKQQDHIIIYGDYDIDGLTATTVLLEALRQFGFKSLDTYIPNRFVEGYGLTVDAVESIAKRGAKLIITVDCGSLSTKEIQRARELGVDVIVTDHHNVQQIQPPAVAVINPKRLLQDYPDEYRGYQMRADSEYRGKIYPFLDLPGVGVAFKLVQALQTRLDGLAEGQEKWLLDLVALGTVCDVVTLVDENRMHVYWGLKVLARTRRPGLRALMAVADVDNTNITARSLGFALGPRMNAAGRLETAEYAQKLLLTMDEHEAIDLATKLDEMNRQRRLEQDRIFTQAKEQAEQFGDDAVLVLSDPGWSHGIIGIVAAKLLEKYQKPAFVLQELGDESKGSARSYGDFSAADAIRSADDLILKGGGHRLAAGVTLATDKIADFRSRVNQFYQQSGLDHNIEKDKLLVNADVSARIEDVTIQLAEQIDSMRPFGNGNPKPVLCLSNLTVQQVRIMGANGQHIKMTLGANGGSKCEFIAFNAPENYFVNSGQVVTVWVEPEINEWQGRRSIEGRIVRLESA